jgi:hypothetical protein
MFKRNDVASPSSWLAMALASLMWGNCLAGVVPVAPAPTTGDELGSPLLATSRQPPKPAAVRCFQEGRLVYESSDVQVMYRHAAVLLLSPRQAGEATVQILDLKQGLCFVETRSP